MGQSVIGIRDTFYHDLAAGYQRDKERSFLYRYFWQENMRELLEKVLPQTLEEGLPGPENSRQMWAKLGAVMGENREWARTLLLRDPPGNGKKERRDFWSELVLNDAGYQAGLITDTDFYQWLTAYLAARDIYYKDSGPWDTGGTAWLYPLLRAGLGTGSQGGLTKAQVERTLKELARQLEEERAAGKTETAGRLHNLKQRIVRNGQMRQVDYLPWLTIRLERAALHSRIRTWLQDGGYPLRADGAVAASGEPRKQDFSLRLFGAYCDSPEGYDFTPRDLSGWHMSGKEFCVADANGLEQLLNALKQRDRQNDMAYLYLPLAVHLQSGCVLFLAGKAVYESAYGKAGRTARDAYKSDKNLFCFDYLRLDNAFWTADAADAPFRLCPTFHVNADRSYSAVLNDFKRYCVIGTDSAIEKVRGLNDEAPFGTPEAFLWAFYPPEPEPSQGGTDAFYRTRNSTKRDPGGPMI